LERPRRRARRVMMIGRGKPRERFGDRERDLRRWGQQQRGGDLDNGANGAIGVAEAMVIRFGGVCAVVIGIYGCQRADRWRKVISVDMSEGQRELEHQRHKR
jgi:hypothetical protein